jgi:23S rRNA (pseudouridine1915-N3)-methyltransferase
MRYRIIAVGRVKDDGVRSACDVYLKRLQHYAKVDETEVKDEARILGSIPEGSSLVALSRGGDAWTSRTLAEHTAEWEMEGRDVGFAIGGAEPLPVDVLQRADAIWSLSAMTLPHELARLIVLEQLYRAHTIRRGEPYHRGP